MDSFNKKKKKSANSSSSSSSYSSSAFHRGVDPAIGGGEQKSASMRGCLAEEKEAFGELNYLKGRARTGAFYECRAQCRPLWRPARRVHVLRVHAHSRVRARAWQAAGRAGRGECANNEGKFVPRSH